jgi:hypothetical protein
MDKARHTRKAKQGKAHKRGKERHLGKVSIKSKPRQLCKARQARVRHLGKQGKSPRHMKARYRDNVRQGKAMHLGKSKQRT